MVYETVYYVSKKKRERINMPLHGFNSEETKIFVDYFNLSKEEDKSKYEELINTADITITREEFTYDRSGKPTITL